MEKNRHFLAARSLGGFFLFTLSLLLTAALTLGGTFAKLPSLPTVKDDAPVTVIIDAGHGGEDGGAVGVTGVLEKDLNMQLSLCLADALREAGVCVVLTRTEDKLLYTEEQNVRGRRKLWDLKNRLLVAENTENAILVSIHMNKYPSAEVSGLMTYYANDAQSRALAVGIQSKVAADFPTMKRRVPKVTGEGIYLLSHAPCPAVLVECGFLSNFEECEKLSQKDYQRQLSFSLFCGIMEYIENNKGV